jgi:hypothetical protein
MRGTHTTPAGQACYDPRCFVLPGIVSLAFCALLGTWAEGQAQTLQPGQPVDPTTLSWPRLLSTNGWQFAVYQPQIDSWQGAQLTGRFAVGVRSTATSNETYGVTFFQARTEIDKVNRLVSLDQFTLTKAMFPTKPGMDQSYLDLLSQQLPQTARTIPLDHLEAVFVVSAEAAKALAVQVKNDPPSILYSTEPAILVLVDGPPILKPLIGTYQRVINTRAVMLYNTADQNDYLYAGSNWYNAQSITGSWNVDPTPPPDIGIALDAALATKQVDPLLPQRPLATPLNVYVSTTPAELVQTSGTEVRVPLPGTALSYVANSDSAIFYHSNDTFYYVLISGRWFKGPYIYGPWTFVPPDSLPPDFQKIPADSPKANALASVPGTPQAQEAVIASSIPQTATINRNSASLTVTYQGSPSFAPVAGTSLAYATNTPTPVIMTGPMTYYACEGGVWFVATSPAGPWAVATSVPKAIYNIPPSSPIYYVTYAYVYGSTPDSVQVGYTPGYNGVYVAPGGTVVYGTGYVYPPLLADSYWVPCPVTYGFGWGMAINPYTGFAYGFAAGAAYDCWCHPYWGCYGWADRYGLGYTHINLNSASFYAHWGTAVRGAGSWGYNAYSGREWSAQRAAVFNPYTGAYVGNERGKVVNPYGAASSASRAVTSTARPASPAAWHSPNVYAGRDGTAYRANPAGGYDRYNAGSGWQAANPASSSWATRENSAQSLGYQRYDNYRSYGGGGWNRGYGRARR